MLCGVQAQHVGDHGRSQLTGQLQQHGGPGVMGSDPRGVETYAEPALRQGLTGSGAGEQPNGVGSRESRVTRSGLGEGLNQGAERFGQVDIGGPQAKRGHPVVVADAVGGESHDATDRLAVEEQEEPGDPVDECNAVAAEQASGNSGQVVHVCGRDGERTGAARDGDLPGETVSASPAQEVASISS